MNFTLIKKVALAISFYILAIFSINCQISPIVLNHLPDDVQPVIGAWFWTEDDFKPEGYKVFLDQVDKHSSYNLLSTANRRPGRDITDIDVYNQIKEAVEYANKLGIKIALELDIRLARRKFAAMYPDELQEAVILQEVELSANNSVECVIQSRKNLRDHMNGRKEKYVPLRGSLLRVYSYEKTEKGIDPTTLKDITLECTTPVSSKDSVVVHIPPYENSSQKQACVLVSFTHLTPAIFAPHMMDFENKIIESYSDIPLAGGIRDEWGFPPISERGVSNLFWYSKFYSLKYAENTNGRDLLSDFLLMYVGVSGKESERYNAINQYMEMNWKRNAALEENFYNKIKEVFGSEAVLLSHPTWYPYPEQREYRKNGLYWWSAKRDWAQTDEVTPFAARTALAKKWGIGYNQYYSTQRKDYNEELWSSALAGERINYHPIYPSQSEKRHIELLQGNLMRGESRVRLLNFISKAPLDCPVAIIFGHSSTMNWAGPYYEDLGMDLVDNLWSKGIMTDLIPTTEIENGNLLVDDEGWVHYGKQRYAAVVLYNPEFEKLSTADFFNKAAKGQTNLFRIGDWTYDFNGNRFNGNAALPQDMFAANNMEPIILKVSKILKRNKTALQTPATRILEGFGHTSNAFPAKGFSRLIDGTLIQVAGTNDAAGDIIDSRMRIGKYDVDFNAIGVAAVRLDEKGDVQALAVGGLKFFKTREFVIQLNERIDVALWKNDDGKFQGVIQGFDGEIPQQLLSITKDWMRLNVPKPWRKYKNQAVLN